MIRLILDHLWQSTLFVAAAAFLTLFLKANSARVRYGIWLSASLKFLLPLALLTAAGKAASQALMPASPAAPIVMALDSATEPFSRGAVALAGVTTSAANSASSWNWTALLALIWLAGFVFVVIRWLRHWLYLRGIVRAAVPVVIAAPMAVKSSPALLEPGLIGAFHPILLLPEGVAGQLSAGELEAVVAHEVCHWRRRDNLTAALHMLVEAIFWFYPLVWWLETRLIAEREAACDEAVVAAGRDPNTYAESILKVCRLYVHSPLPCAAGVSGADLKQRMEKIMENQFIIRLSGLKKIALAALAVAVLAGPLALGVLNTPAALAQTAAQAPLDTPEKIAERRAEQSVPRKVVPFDPSHFDKYVGYYKLRSYVVAAVRRDGSNYLFQLTGQPDVAFFPESETKFFATVVPAQASFDIDASGNVTGMVIHQNGLEQHAPRIDEATAKKLEAELLERVKNHTPSPGTEGALRAYLQSLESGKPDLSNLSPILATIARTQLPALVADMQSLGPIQAINFKTVGAGGFDVYDVHYERGVWEWSIGPLNADGKIDTLQGRPAL